MIVCGGGSNGGDGFVAARQLARPGLPVRVLLTAPPAKIQGDAAAALDGAGSGASGRNRRDDRGRQRLGRRHDLADATGRRARSRAVVDAIFGTGFPGPGARRAGGRDRRHERRGRAQDRGRHPVGARRRHAAAPSGVVFRADVTATMGARKLGLCVDASAPVGRIEIVDLGAPVDERSRRPCAAGCSTTPGIAARLPRRNPDAHKGSKGHLLVVAGSAGKTGAAFLIGTAALRSGAGLVTVASTAAGQIALDAKAIELMTARYTDGDDADPTAALAALATLAARAQAVALGPGIPTGEGMRAVVRELAARAPLPMVIDADGLNALGTEARRLILKGAPAPRVLTPHPGEMGRLLGTLDRRGAGRSDRPRARPGRRFGRRSSCSRGRGQIVAAPDGRCSSTRPRCSALATAGSGDVLCGVVGRAAGAPAGGAARRPRSASTCTARPARSWRPGSATACWPAISRWRSRASWRVSQADSGGAPGTGAPPRQPVEARPAGLVGHRLHGDAAPRSG